MTYEQKRRIIESITETDRVIEKAKSYMDKHQDKELIAKMEAHKTKLFEMLEA